jgi:hypothetical protein
MKEWWWSKIGMGRDVVVGDGQGQGWSRERDWTVWVRSEDKVGGRQEEGLLVPDVMLYYLFGGWCR